MRRIDRALDLTAFAKRQALDGIGREKYVGRLRREIPLRGTQESKALFGHLQPAFHDDRLALRLRRITAPIIAPIIAPIFTRITTTVFALATTLIIAPLLVVATIAAAAAAAALIVALPLMAPMSLMVTAMTTPATAAALTEAALAAARTEGTLMPLLPLRPALLGIPLKPGGISSDVA